MNKAPWLAVAFLIAAPLGAASKGGKKAPPAQSPSASPAPQAPSAAPAAPTTAQENLGSMEVTGQAKDKVLIEKPTPEIKIDVRDMVDSVTEKTEKLLERPRPVPGDEDFQRFDRLSSNQTARPWLPELAEPPLISFRPEPAKTTVKGWRLEITDETGEVIQTLTGNGNPVDEIVWDGTVKDGKMIKVATAYSFRFITVDEYKNAHTTLGKAFTLKHLKFEDKKNMVVEISSKFLFKDEKIAPEALPIFERTLDVLRDYSRYPFALEFHTDAPQGDLVKARQKVVTEKITRDMLLPKDSIKYTYSEIKDRGDVLRFVVRLR
ncbi:MAG TPA: hypothetical protein PKZ00_06795 [Elusimicrobiota bacterium]|jgi:hypothetical protein|nr:hypothetical protein [Elusimicrobiota bacterium]